MVNAATAQLRLLQLLCVYTSIDCVVSDIGEVSGQRLEHPQVLVDCQNPCAHHCVLSQID